MRSSFFFCLTALALLILSASAALAQDIGYPGAIEGEQTPFIRTATDVSRTADLNSLMNTSWFYDFSVDDTMYINKLNFGNEFETQGSFSGLVVSTHNGLEGWCFDGSDFGLLYDYHCKIPNTSWDPPTTYYLDFNVNSNTASGLYYYVNDNTNEYSNNYTLYLTRRYATGSSGEGAYYVPYIPDDTDYMVGFGLSNAGNDEANSVTVAYYGNDGTKVGEESVSIPANRHYAFIKGVETTEDGWALVTSSRPLYGMSLIFGYDETPFFDVDMTSELSNNLTIAHMDTDVNGSWKSYAMFCNPNSSSASVTLTFYPTDAGSSTATQNLTIPAMGSVQYDLSVFQPNGSIQASSTQPLAGFMLFDGRDSGSNWLGGLSIVPTK